MNATSTESIVTMGTFFLNGLEFGVDILQQREVLRVIPVTKIPHAAAFIQGVINLRGAIIPIINLRKRFGMPDKEFDSATRILNIESSTGFIVGFIVDAVGQVRYMETSRIEETPPIAVPVNTGYISGVGKCDDDLLLILNVAQVLAHDGLEAVHSAA